GDWKFYEHYGINQGEYHHESKSDSGKQRGLKTTFGLRGSICAHFGWTIDYLENEISWAKVQRMIADQPRYET
ncbi:hypothetical protein ACQ1PN_12045, partial [Ornithobacterium rhinotracheale]